jgi:hypothetical protein
MVLRQYSVLNDFFGESEGVCIEVSTVTFLVTVELFEGLIGWEHALRLASNDVCHQRNRVKLKGCEGCLWVPLRLR